MRIVRPTTPSTERGRETGTYTHGEAASLQSARCMTCSFSSYLLLHALVPVPGSAWPGLAGLGCLVHLSASQLPLLQEGETSDKRANAALIERRQREYGLKTADELRADTDKVDACIEQASSIAVPSRPFGNSATAPGLLALCGRVRRVPSASVHQTFASLCVCDNSKGIAAVGAICAD